MAEPVHITFLGGLGDIGRNCAAIECAGSLLLLDCGTLFPDETMPGARFVLPDLDYLRSRADRIVGCICTHGHEDHIGGLSHALAEFSFPVYGSPFTLGLVKRRLSEWGLMDRTELIPLHDGERRSLGPFDCEFIPVTHSVPSGLITALRTPQGVILHSSDFKLDLDPVDGRHTGLARIGTISDEEGVRLLLCDSTNADLPGSSRSESEVGGVLRSLLAAHSHRRVIVAAFSSHIHRVQQVATAAVEAGRVVTTLGLSMKKNVALARQLALLRIPDSSLVDIQQAARLPPEQVCVISTGSQGETRSALARAAGGDSRWLKVGADDTVVLSSSPIPGNEARVARMINDLVRRGAQVVHSGQLDVHTTGHGKQDELRVLHNAAGPEHFVPVHGEYRHLVAHADLARSMGIPDANVVLATDGEQVQLDDSGLHHRGRVTSGAYFFSQGKLVESNPALFKERVTLGSEGSLVVVVGVDVKDRSLVFPTRIESYGWVAEENYEEIHAAGAAAVDEVVSAYIAKADLTDADNEEYLERLVRRTTGQFISDRTGRRPMIQMVLVLLDR